jgi:hypothetical protein
MVSDNSNNSGSLDSSTVTIPTSALSSIVNELQSLKDVVKSMELQQLSKELQLPVNVISNSDEFKPVRRLKRGLGSITLLESEIRDAQEKTHTAGAAAKYLKVNYYTYRKYAQLYGVWKTNRSYRSEEGYKHGVESGKYPLSRLLNGDFPDYPVFRLKDKLILGGVKAPECEQCGYKERRITDSKIPLILNFQDGNQRNHKLENIKVLCYNCTFCSGVGYIRRGKRYHHQLILGDPDRAQGAVCDIPSRF